MRLRSTLAAGLWALALLTACTGDEALAPGEERPPVEIGSSVDRPVVTTGDLITYSVTVNQAPEWEVEVPQPGAEVGGLEVVDRRSEAPRMERGRRIVDHWYILRADQVGSFTLPEIVAEVRPAGGGSGPVEAVASEPISIEVQSVLPADGSATEIRDIKPVREIRLWDWRPWAALLAAAILLAGLGLWWWRRRRRPVPEAPPIPPHVLALQRLEALHRSRLEDRRAVRRYYFAISAILRAYVEGRFGLNATDLTTEEIVDRLSGISDLGAREAIALETFLDATDAVKYAARVPTEGDVEQVYQAALEFVETTRPGEPQEGIEEEVAA